MGNGYFWKHNTMGGEARVFQYKLVLLGESAVGKSSLVLRFVKNAFSEHQESTIGAAFLTQTLQAGGDTLKFEIWDTAGQERYNSLAPMYYRGAHAAVVVYDISKRESFERARRWVDELHANASPGIVIGLVGNKADLANERQVESSAGEAYASEAGLVFREASARTGEGVHEAFAAVAAALPRTEDTSAARRAPAPPARVSLSSGDSPLDSAVSKCC